MKEFCAVKSIRAWTYLQLVLNYGKIPFFTEPLLSKEQAEAAENGMKADLQYVCRYFIDDLKDLPQKYNVQFPGYRDIRGVHSKLLFFPLSIVRGDLYLWLATVTNNKEYYKEAAWHYYKYISERNGEISAYPTGREDYCYWAPGTSNWNSPSGIIFPVSESDVANAELITMIAGDSIRAEGHYSELRNFFTYREENDGKVSIVPSVRLQEISAAQQNCVLSANGQSVYYAPPGLERHRSGDLRLQDAWYEGYTIDRLTGDKIESQYIYKYNSQRNVHIYRRTMVYLRLAEALNMAGYPHMAYQILAEGLSNKVISEKVMPHYHADETETSTLSDSLFLAKFDFPDVRYAVCTAEDFLGRGTAVSTHNMMGIHSRGSGFTPLDTTYVLPHDTVELDLVKRAQLIKEQQVYVDNLILNESALEFAFEGTRFYDIMRYALHQQNPGATMQKIIGARRGQDNPISVPLNDQSNWYLNWNGKIGYTIPLD